MRSWIFSEFCAAESPNERLAIVKSTPSWRNCMISSSLEGSVTQSVFDVGLDSARGELGGERRRDFVDQGTTARSATVEKRHSAANLIGKLLIGEPGEILEHHRHDRSVFQLEVHCGAIVLGGETEIHARKDT